jgi:hypothetical protein
MVELIVFIIGFALGWWLQSWLSAQAFVKILNDLGVSDDRIAKLAEEDGVDVTDYKQAAANNTTIQLKVESVNGMLMAYRAEDDFYVAQGVDAEKLLEAIVDKHPMGKIEVVEGGDLVRDYVETLK